MLCKLPVNLAGPNAFGDGLVARLGGSCNGYQRILRPVDRRRCSRDGLSRWYCLYLDLTLLAGVICRKGAVERQRDIPNRASLAARKGMAKATGPPRMYTYAESRPCRLGETSPSPSREQTFIHPHLLFPHVLGRNVVMPRWHPQGDSTHHICQLPSFCTRPEGDSSATQTCIREVRTRVHGGPLRVEGTFGMPGVPALPSIYGFEARCRSHYLFEVPSTSKWPSWPGFYLDLSIKCGSIGYLGILWNLQIRGLLNLPPDPPSTAFSSESGHGSEAMGPASSVSTSFMSAPPLAR